jgi:hypothetical protein
MISTSIAWISYLLYTSMNDDIFYSILYVLFFNIFTLIWSIFIFFKVKEFLSLFDKTEDTLVYLKTELKALRDILFNEKQ